MTRVVLALFAALVLAPSAGSAEPIVLPLRLHIVGGVTIEKRGVAMESWIGADELRRTVVPSVNEIWRQAGIEWRVASIETVAALSPPDREQRLATIRDASRDARGKADPARIRAWEGLLDLAAADGAAVDVYLVPYLGETSQGNASRRHKRALVALWTDKPSRGRKPPQRVRLVPASERRANSLSRTIAHELGHVLGLRHPRKKTQTEFRRLMGGKKPGLRLTRDEIERARSTARDLF